MTGRIAATGRVLSRRRLHAAVASMAALTVIAWATRIGGTTLPAAPTLAAVAGSLLLATLSVLVIEARQDAQQYHADEAVLVVSLLIAPDAVLWSAPMYALLWPMAGRYLGVVSRVRRNSLLKRIFNGFSTALGYVAASSAFAVLAPLLGETTAAVLGGLTHTVVTLAAFAVVLRCGGVPISATELRRSSVTSLVAASMLIVLGLGITEVVRLAPQPTWALAIVTIGGYLVARRRIPRTVQTAVDSVVLQRSPQLLTAEDIDTATAQTAAELLGAGYGQVRSQPAGHLECGVRLGDHPASPWLVVGDRLGEVRGFDHSDEQILRSLARVAEPIRAHVRALERLQHSDASRGAILGALGHDLRSPVNVAGMAGRTLTKHGQKLDDDAKQRLVDVIVANLDRSASILDDLLELERRALVTDDEDVAIVSEVIDKVVASATDRAVAIPGPDVAVATDPVVLGRVLDNLVQNADRYAPDGEIVLWWRVCGEDVVIAVDDAGPGIEPQDRDRLLQPFSSGAGHNAGVGLGLHLASRFAELAGGRLEIGSSDQSGASIRVVLPAREVPAPRAAD